MLTKSRELCSPQQTTINLSYPLYATIDIQDFAALSKYHWSARKSHSCWYAVRKETIRGIRRTVFMHRQIMNATPDQEVHHGTGGTLDNRRSNLSVLTPRLHHLTHAELRLLTSSPQAKAACANALAQRGITALCPYGPFRSSKPGEPPKDTPKLSNNIPPSTT